MIRLLVARLLQSMVVLVVVYTATFWMLMAVPGDPFIGEKKPPQSVVESLHAKYHFEKGKLATFWYYSGAALRLDFGSSIAHQDQTVGEMIVAGLPYSIAIGSLALLAALWMGLAMGTVAAIFKGRWQDSVLAVVTLTGISVPLFVVAAGILYLFAVQWPVFTDLGGLKKPSQLVMPVATLAVYYLAAISRLARVSVIEEFSMDYVRTARAKGLGWWRVVTHHVLRNASLPVLSYLGPAAAGAITGSFVVEKIFAVPGMGKSFVDACIGGDLPVVLGGVLVFTAIVLGFNFVVDVAYAMADPRIGAR